MRVFLLLLLCLTIPFQGVAAAHAFKVPCPMETAGHAHTVVDGMTDANEDTDADAKADCCNDAATAAETGKLCKTGQECPTGGLGILIRPSISASARITALTFSPSPLFIPSFDPATVWRPPTLI